VPFDGSRLSSDIALQSIERVIDLLSSEGKWCKGVRETDDGRYCLARAIQLTNAQAVLEPVILGAILEITGRSFWQIETFNDRFDTTHAEVRRVLLLARERILARAVILVPRDR